MIIILSILFFAMFDYIGYNLAVRYKLVNSKFINPYRITQALMQIAITLTLYFLWSRKEAVSFNFLWWTWTADWIYYLYCFLINYNDTRRHWLQAFDGIVTWAFFTPIGIYHWTRTGNKDTIISGNVLCLQTLLGILLTILINYIW